jgi:hypothetical protein
MVMKIDVEGYEWDVFSSIDVDTLGLFSQIVVEFHWFDHLYKDDIDDIYYDMKRSLEKLAGIFAPVHIHANNYCDMVIIGGVPVPPVLEVTYVRREKFQTQKSIRTFPASLDLPNDPSRPDLHLGAFRFSYEV